MKKKLNRREWIRGSIVNQGNKQLLEKYKTAGSGIISSIIFNFNKSSAVSFIASAASKDLVGSLHKIEAHPSGEITE